MRSPGTDLPLGFGIQFPDLYTTAGVRGVDAAFLTWLKAADAELHGRLTAARAAPDALDHGQGSELMIGLAPHLDDFLAKLFGIEAQTRALAERIQALTPLYACKRLFVQRRAVKKYPDPSGFDGGALRADLERRGGGALAGPDFELGFARTVNAWGDHEAAHAV